MDRLTAMRVFVHVVDTGSLTAAADKMDMSRSMASRYLAELEIWLKARLLHRSTRRISLTEAGEGALQRCRQMLALADETVGAVATMDDVPRGLIRVTCSVSFAQAHLAAALAGYVALHPEAKVDLLAVDRTVNLVEERVDLAIRITNELDPNLIARRLGACRSVACATPEYLKRYGTPMKPEELSAHNCLTYSYFGKSIWRFGRGGQRSAVPVCGNFSANEVVALTQAALADTGVALQPMYVVAPFIRAGKLVALLPDWKADEMGIHCVYTSRRQMPVILRTLMDFLAERFEPVFE